MTPVIRNRQPNQVCCQANLSTMLAPARGMAAWLQLTGLLMLATVVGASLAGCGGSPKKPFEEAMEAHWKGAGAEMGWMGKNKFGFMEFFTHTVGLTAPVPAFKFANWPENIPAKLPDPGVPFGLESADTLLTDTGLKELAELKSMQMLNLGRTKVTDAGVKELAGLKGLQMLYLDFTQVADAGVKELAELKRLESLDLSGTKVTDAGLKELAELTSLQCLYLYGTKITDAGLKELGGIKSLKKLKLQGTQVTDAGLKELVGLTSLQSLDLRDTKVTETGVASLRKALPACRITLVDIRPLFTQ